MDILMLLLSIASLAFGGGIFGYAVGHSVGYRKANREFYDPAHWLGRREKRLEKRDILSAEVIE